MAVQQVQLLAASFSNTASADKCLQVLKQMDKDGSIDVLDAAVLVKQEDGKLKVNEVKELTPKKGRRRGAVVGGIFGIIFPPSLIVSAIAGGVIGGLIGRFTDQGWKNDDLKAFGDELPAGHSAIVAIVEDKWVEQTSRALAGYDKLTTLAVDADVAAALIAAEDQESGATSEVLVARSTDAATGVTAGVVAAQYDDPVSGVSAGGVAAGVEIPEDLLETGTAPAGAEPVGDAAPATGTAPSDAAAADTATKTDA